MAFVNEYIPTEDYEKYDLRRVCGEHNRAHRGHMYSRSWTIDRERDAFLIQVWFHHESDFSGWAFCWRGNWMFFEMSIVRAVDNKEEDASWSLYRIRNFSIPIDGENEEQIKADLQLAFSAYAGGGVLGVRTHRSATVEFIME